MKFSSVSFTVILALCAFMSESHAQDAGNQVEEKLYNFDDMLIDGAFRDPQGMFERARAEAQFEGVLNLERSFMPGLEDNAQEPSMRP